MVITVAQYKKIEYINSVHEYDEVEKLAYIVGEVYDLSNEKVNFLPAHKFRKMVAKINKTLNQPKAFWQLSVPILTDATKLTFGQFVDLQHWFKQPEYINIESIIARLLVGANLKQIEEDKKTVLKLNIQKVLYKYSKFKDSYEKLMRDNKDLFEQEVELEEGEELPEGSGVHPFIETFGWFYVGEQFKEYFGIKLDDVFELPILEAFSALNYLKAKQGYEKQMIKN